ncbi:ATP-binding protein [Bdellovibrio sp. HCB-162]|uniref:sensor histidine kinase n=1 Tax=Bdellovibrio sp. HCB-162 TaxID=3394234 RepID=UPI0039BC7663
MQQKIIPFRIHPRAIKELGERLVTDDFVALSELVKNSYDAMAKKVTVRFGEDSQGSFIEVEDDGYGMSETLIREVWTVLFTPYKKILAAKGQKGRALSGEKGIGRLSAARLGGELEIYTQEQGKKCIQLLLDWSSLDSLDSPSNYTDFDFSGFGVVIEEAAASPFLKNSHGTLIRLSKLKRKDWLSNEELFEQMTSELSRIRPPLRRYEGFDIFVEHPVFSPSPLCLTDNAPSFLDKPHYFLKGKVDERGQVKGRMLVRKRGINDEKSINEKLEAWSDHASCGPFSFEFRVWDLDSDSIKDIGYEYKLGNREVRDAIRLNKGVSLYRDDILVLPKTAGNDWLKLEQRRVSRVGDKLSSANIIAFVDIGIETNPEIKDTADREALESNPASAQLTASLIEIIKILEDERKIYKFKSEGTQSFYNLLESEKVISTLQIIRDSIENEEEKERVIKNFEILETEIQKQKDTIAERLGYYSRLASVGTIASYMAHEVRNSSTAISASNREGRKALEVCDSKDKEAILKRLDTSDRALSSLESLSSAILPLAGAKFRRKAGQKVALDKLIDSCLDANRKVIESSKTEIIRSGTNIELAMTEGELFVLLQNLFQNSLYWLSKVDKERRKIHIRVGQQIDNFVTIYIEDSGTGIREDFLEAVFMPGVSSKPDGTGMGLTVVAEICEKYRGSVSAGNSKKLDGASFKLVLPLE